jgi:hypothetical protein
MSSDDLTAETAIVLGAGASIPPLIGQQDLVLKLVNTVGVERLFPAQKYLRNVFPGLVRGQVEPGTLQFEDIVGPLEIAESEEYWFHFGGRRRAGSGAVLTNKAVLDSLDTWVGMALDPQTLPKRPGKHDLDREAKEQKYSNFYSPSSSSQLAYAQLVALLRESEVLERTVFISMNYDVLLERVLLASGTHVPDYWVDGFYEEPDSRTAGHPVGRPLTLLKLHGSLNWRVCDRCHILRDHKELIVWPNDRCCDCEGDSARPMLIRPTLLKDFRHRVWRDIWRQAGHVLASAATWVFIGYSLPLADVWMLRLLAQSKKSGSIRPEARRIIVVNPDPAVRQRFGLLFPKMAFHEMPLSKWIEDCRKKGEVS